ncbi:hypothetical protein N9119_03625 [Roseivirga sp.]|nr:hypothetical protein [Roseivirga sp.]
MRLKYLSILILVFIIVGAPTANAQSSTEKKTEKPLSKREKRQLLKAKKLEAKIEEVITLIEARNFVIKDDGATGGLYPQSGLVNFFRIKNDTVTFQRQGAKPLGTGVQEAEVIDKFQGIIQSLNVIEAEGNLPPRVVVSYLDRITREFRRTVIYIFPSRVEARREDGTGLVIRGKYYTIENARVRELGINSERLLVETAQRY